MKIRKPTPYMFFKQNAGYSYDPQIETAEQGKRRTARELAAAEEQIKTLPVGFVWQQDDITSEEHSDEKPFYPLWLCLLLDENGKTLESLCGIDFGRDKEPWGDPYRRVVEAELALEYLNRNKD